MMLLGGSRMFFRVYREYMMKDHTSRRVLIIGAGDAGELIVRDMTGNHKSGYLPVGFIDDDPYKRGLRIHNVPILGGIGEIESIIQSVIPDEFLICIPSADNKTLRSLFDRLQPFRLPIKILPGLADIIAGKVSVSAIKPMSLEDLLMRQPVRTDIAAVREFIRGRVVLVTGAGGSIGSELARQIAEYDPERLILLDRYENSLYHTDIELKSRHGNRITSVIRDVTDRKSLASLFSNYKPEIVFHAAAHKHVPLMEMNPLEAVKNNVFGTLNIIELSALYSIKHFVMVSTDKAVNPTNVMGATKRIAEFLALRADNPGGTRFTTVRFGNVLGSNGSVFHVFRDQLAKGGPITVTHPDIKRYFMLIPEAVQLVLMAASIGKGGNIYVLDMGEPIRIVDFAENFIKLSGYVPYEDIDIVFTGLRPGEKLFEELFDTEEVRLPAEHEAFKIAKPKMPSTDTIDRTLTALREAVGAEDETALPAIIRTIVPGYKSSSEVVVNTGPS